MAGEFLAPLSKLGEWQHHPRRGSRLKSDHASALALTVSDPMIIEPIVVLAEADGSLSVVDGRFRWAALVATHGPNSDVEVRCILFHGSEEQAVASTSDRLLGSVTASAIEQAQALLSLQRTCRISQTAIAERYPRLTVSKVSNMVIAARIKEAYPDLFNILDEPDRAPISYGVDLQKVIRKLSNDEVKALLHHAEGLLEAGERFKPAEALVALGAREARRTPAEERTLAATTPSALNTSLAKTISRSAPPSSSTTARSACASPHRTPFRT